MGILPYQTLVERGEELIEPFDPKMVQPASIDLTLGDHFIWYHYHHYDRSRPEKYIDIARRSGVDAISEHMDEFILAPKEFVLATTIERVSIPNNLVARVEGKSSIGRLGLAIHSTAGFLDPGFQGQITLELFNFTKQNMVLMAGMSICQVAFEQLSDKCEKPYGSPGLGSHYQNQVGTTLSRSS